MKANQFTIRWYHSFLTNRMQQVGVNSTLSDALTTTTGGAQGCVSSPFLLTVYTNNCVSMHPSNYVVKFSDDTAVLGLLNKGSDTNGYRAEIKGFIRWCDEHHL